MPKPKEKTIPNQNQETPKLFDKQGDIDALDIRKREKSRTVVNLQSEIFLIIEEKSKILQEITEKQETVKQMGEKILEMQRTLNGERKVLKGIEAEIQALTAQTGQSDGDNRNIG